MNLYLLNLAWFRPLLLMADTRAQTVPRVPAGFRTLLGPPLRTHVRLPQDVVCTAEGEASASWPGGSYCV